VSLRTVPPPLADARAGALPCACDVLAVFAHPDDESLLAGGTLAACAAAGLRVGVVSMTRGELGGAAYGSDLGAVRERELIDAAAALGSTWARCLDLPDGELGSVDPDRALQALGALGQCEPRALLTFSADGLYWHPDHIAVHEIVRRVFPHERIFEFSWPPGLLAEVVDELRRRGLPSDVWGLDPGAFGAPAGAIVRELDVSGFLDAKLRALRCHRSQLLSGHALTELPHDLAERLLGREWLTSDRDSWLVDVVAAASEGVR
jgi:LmbE family N-acetylglucosaminyl deacetylase